MNKIVSLGFGFFCLALLTQSLFGGAVTIYNYRIYCETEQQNVYTWRETPPTVCPNDPAHTINPNSISIVDEMAPDIITVKDEYIPTGHNFKTETRKISVAAGPDVITTEYFSWPFNISVMNLYFVTNSDHQNDIILLDAPFDRIMGNLTADVQTGTTVLPVSPTVFQYAYVGYLLSLDDGTNQDNLGRILAMDRINNLVTVETPTSYNFSALTPTYVKITQRTIDFEIGCPDHYGIGLKTIQGSHLPANEQARLQYINKSSVEKTFILIYEYLY